MWIVLPPQSLFCSEDQFYLRVYKPKRALFVLHFRAAQDKCSIIRRIRKHQREHDRDCYLNALKCTCFGGGGRVQGPSYTCVKNRFTPWY